MKEWLKKMWKNKGFRFAVCYGAPLALLGVMIATGH
jgi:hypothetical protein